MSRPLRLLILQLLLILLVAAASSYELPDFSQLTQDVVLFLTPYGIFKNLSDPNSPLRAFYFETSVGQEQLTNLKFGLLAVLYAILLLNFSLIAKGLKRK
jgi:hypothetical protein